MDMIYLDDSRKVLFHRLLAAVRDENDGTTHVHYVF
jgi:hypothetical protein